MPRFDVTIAGELNLDLILYGLPNELPPERELLAERMMLTLGSSSAIVGRRATDNWSQSNSLRVSASSRLGVRSQLRNRITQRRKETQR